MTRFTISSVRGTLVGFVTLAAIIATPHGRARAQQPAPVQPQTQAPPAAQGQRLQRLEEQIFDLNAHIATLQSLVSNSNAAPAQPGAPFTAPSPGVPSGNIEQRISVIETQISALSGQIEQLSGQLSQMQTGLYAGQQPPVATPQTELQPQGQLQQLQPQVQLQPQGQLQPQVAVPQTQGQVQPQAEQPRQSIFGGFFGRNAKKAAQPEQPAQPAQPALRPGVQPGAIPLQQPQTTPVVPQQQAAIAPSADARAAYDAAYNQLLQRDFKSAEAGFRNFLVRHPSDALAGNAQYWLGETYYVRGQFRQAADSFLTGYKKYKSGDKAPANLLKLGMALHQLGEKDSACATFEELTTKFPRAPAHIKQRAASERQRSGC